MYLFEFDTPFKNTHNTSSSVSKFETCTFLKQKTGVKEKRNTSMLYLFLMCITCASKRTSINRYICHHISSKAFHSKSFCLEWPLKFLVARTDRLQQTFKAVIPFNSPSAALHTFNAAALTLTPLPISGGKTVLYCNSVLHMQERAKRL